MLGYNSFFFFRLAEQKHARREERMNITEIFFPYLLSMYHKENKDLWKVCCS